MYACLFSYIAYTYIMYKYDTTPPPSTMHLHTFSNLSIKQAVYFSLPPPINLSPSLDRVLVASLSIYLSIRLSSLSIYE